RDSPDLYKRYGLGYLHARAKLGHGELDGARAALEPFLAPGQDLRDLALHYAAQVAQAQGKKDEAALARETLVGEFPTATYRQTDLEDLAASLSAAGDPRPLADLAARVAGSV